MKQHLVADFSPWCELVYVPCAGPQVDPLILKTTWVQFWMMIYRMITSAFLLSIASFYNFCCLYIELLGPILPFSSIFSIFMGSPCHTFHLYKSLCIRCSLQKIKILLSARIMGGQWADRRALGRGSSFYCLSDQTLNNSPASVLTLSSMAGLWGGLWCILASSWLSHWWWWGTIESPWWASGQGNTFSQVTYNRPICFPVSRLLLPRLYHPVDLVHLLLFKNNYWSHRIQTDHVLSIHHILIGSDQ